MYDRINMYLYLDAMDTSEIQPSIASGTALVQHGKIVAKLANNNEELELSLCTKDIQLVQIGLAMRIRLRTLQVDFTRWLVSE